MSVKSLSIVAAAALALCAGAVQAQNKLFNGGFEIGQTTVPADPVPVPNVDPTKAQGWIPGDTGYERSNDAYAGSFSALIRQARTDTAGQAFQNSVATGGMPALTPGETLKLSFWAKAMVNADKFDDYNMGYEYRLLNSNGGIEYNSGFVKISTMIKNGEWSLIQGPDVVVPEKANAAFLLFSAAAGGRTAAFLVDEVSLVPEPSTYALMLAGLAGVGLLAKRRRQA